MAKRDINYWRYNWIFFSLISICIIASTLSWILGISSLNLVTFVIGILIIFMMIYYGPPRVSSNKTGIFYRYMNFLKRHYILMPLIAAQICFAIVIVVLALTVDMPNGLAIRVIVPSLAIFEAVVALALITSKRIYGKS